MKLLCEGLASQVWGWFGGSQVNVGKTCEDTNDKRSILDLKYSLPSKMNICDPMEELLMGQWGRFETLVRMSNWSNLNYCCQIINGYLLEILPGHDGALCHVRYTVHPRGLRLHLTMPVEGRYPPVTQPVGQRHLDRVALTNLCSTPET